MIHQNSDMKITVGLFGPMCNTLS